MRLTEFTHNLTNKQRLDEVNMRPSNLKSLASNINARAGMEFELCVPETISYDLDHSFSEAIGKRVVNGKAYHKKDIDRPNHENNFYLVEPDGSIRPDNDNDNDIGLEFVSPAMSVDEMISDLDKVAKWAGTNGCYTNESTGLHINISVDNWSSQKGHLDYVKLVLLSGDQHILEEFNRQGNEYCKNALENINKMSGKYIPNLFQEMKSGLTGLAQDIIKLNTKTIAKYTSIHPKDGYVEFRSPGGSWLGIYQSNPGKIINTMLRYVVALDAAVDPEKYRNEYLKKLYAMVKPKSNHDPISYFVQYAAGEIDFDELARNTSAIRSRHDNNLVGDISNLTGIIPPKLTGKVSQYLKGDVSYITGDVSNIEGDVSNIEGDVTDIEWDVSDIKGNVSNIKGRLGSIRGDVSNISGSINNILGDVSNIKGDVSNISGILYNISGDVSNISGDVSHIRGHASNIEGDVGDIEGNVSKLKGDVSNIGGDVSNIEGDVSNISGNVLLIQGDVSKLNGDVSYIRKIVSNIEGDPTWIQGDVSKLKGDVSKLEGDVGNIEGNVSNLYGTVNLSLKGDVSNLTGDATGCKGDVTGLTGDIKEALKASS